MIRFGIAGFGLHAVKRLMPGFQAASRCTVTALSRRSAEDAAESARRYEIPHAFASVSELCRSPEVDAVFVTTPDALHLAHVLESIGQRLPVLCEKPMAMSTAEAREMTARATGAGVLLGVAHVFRFEESVRRVRQMVRAGTLGRPLTARADFFYDGRDSPRTWITDPTLACGGPIADVGVHCIDTLRLILDSDVEAVQAQAVTDELSLPFESTATLTLLFGGGTLGSVSVSTRSGYRTFLEVVGEEATVSAVDALAVDRPITVRLRRSRTGEVVHEEIVSNEDAYARQVDAFAAAVEGAGPFEVPGEEGVKNQIVLDAAYRSWRTGRVERI